MSENAALLGFTIDQEKSLKAKVYMPIAIKVEVQFMLF